MTFILGLIIVSVALYLVGYPLLKPEVFNDYEWEEAPEDNKEYALSKLDEVEFDYRMGKISKEDYTDLRGKYVHE